MSDQADVALLSDAEIIARSSPLLNPHLTLLIERAATDPAAIHFAAANFGGAAHWRVNDTIGYLRELHAIAVAAGRDLRPAPGRLLVFQADDNARDLPSVSWERQRGWPAVQLVPDIYYYQARGYMDYRPALPAWRERPETFVWRGSSTGLPGFVADELDQLPRYRMCRLAQEFGHADVGITLVIQGRTPDDDHIMNARLHQERLHRTHISMDDMGAAGRFIFDIDGNANSWNFMAKLRLGCCVIRIESEWQQWFHDRLEPWRHYVPVRSGLEDLHEKMAWCLAHPAHAECIAAEGTAFAHAMDFDAEMRLAAETVFAA